MRKPDYIDVVDQHQFLDGYLEIERAKESQHDSAQEDDGRGWMMIWVWQLEPRPR